MSDRYKFDDLTNAQKALLTFQGWRPEMNAFIRQPAPRTAKKLLDRGQLEPVIRNEGYYTVTTYEVPLDVHVAWCAYSAEKEEAHE